MKPMKLRKRLRLQLINTIFVLLIILAASANRINANIDDAICLDCHEEMAANLDNTVHQLSSQVENPKVDISCISCHEGAETHLEDPSRENIINPKELTGRKSVEVCNQCHVAHDNLDNFGFDAHSVSEMNCSECHSVHGGRQALLVDDRAGFCFNCHQMQKLDFKKLSNHPVMQGELTCLSCHRFAKRAGDNLAYQLGGICRDCHPEQGGPFMFEHEAVNAYSVEGSGCIECHNPHGSENDRLLRQPRQQLCIQCHSTPPGHLNSSAHGYVWSDYKDCTLCHTGVHGSFDNPLLLDPNLTAIIGVDCYQAGCHVTSH